MEQHAVGIDFGTSTTLIAVSDHAGEARVIPIGETTTWMPSVAALDPSGSLVVGEAALAVDPRRQIRSIKARLTQGEIMIEVDGVQLEARVVMKAILGEALRRAEVAVPGAIRHTSQVFLGCPALWTGAQRRLLADVVHELGLLVDVADIIDEPVAAGLNAVHSSLLKGQLRLEGRVVIFDAGGGTLDVAYLDVQRHPEEEFTVLSADGIPISGDAVDERVANRLSPALARLDDRSLAEALLRLRARELKEALSHDERRSIVLGGGYDVLLEMSRVELEDVFGPQLGQSVGATRSTVRGAEIRSAQAPSPAEIRAVPWTEVARPVSHVVLVGGLSQMPVIADRMRQEFTSATVSLVDSPQESVALGLALGSRLNRLNLPRPPVSFIVEFGPRDVIESLGLQQWAIGNREIYNAFTPLYRWSDIQIGRSPLGFRYEIPFPPGVNRSLRIRIRCEAPTRERTPLRLRFRQMNDDSILDEGDDEWIEVSHDAHRPARFSLYVNGDLVVTGSNGETWECRVDKWPVLRGLLHDGEEERRLEVSLRQRKPYGSSLEVDDWRYN